MMKSVIVNYFVRNAKYNNCWYRFFFHCIGQLFQRTFIVYLFCVIFTFILEISLISPVKQEGTTVILHIMWKKPTIYWRILCPNCCLSP